MQELTERLNRNAKGKKLMQQSATSKALTEALVLAITASTNTDSRRAVWLAGELASKLQPAEVAKCQAQAKKILNLQNT